VREAWSALRPTPVAGEVRRMVRWWSARWFVRLVGTALGLALVASTAYSWSEPRRTPVTAEVPSLDRLDAALVAAGSYLDGLYRELPDGRAIVAEYYGLPLVARVGGSPAWTRPGDPGLRIDAGEVSRVRETALFRYDVAGEREKVVLFVSTRWARSTLHVEVGQVDGPLADVRLGLGDLPLAHWPAGSARRSAAVTLSHAERHRLQSLRYTVRHVAMMSESAYAYRGEPGRSQRLAALVADAGYDADADVYAPAWGRSPEQPDDFAFAASVYRDCTDPAVVAAMPTGRSYYPYQSKVCAVPTPGYVAMSREDPLVPLATALHVVTKYDDPHRRYSDGEHLNETPARVAAQMEQRFRKQHGIPECLLGACGSTATSTLRSALFGMLETELGYERGDDVSRTYADAVATRLLNAQVGPDGLVPTTTYGQLLRPQEAGGFYTRVSAAGFAGEPPSFVSEQMDRVASALDIRPEYVGDISTNAETTLVVYAFLVRYRCARYDVGCAEGAEPTELLR
jgi:hypothetical protein